MKICTSVAWVVLTGALLLGGCDANRNNWAKNYTSWVDDDVVTLTKTSHVQIRTVEIARMEEWGEECSKYLASINRAKEDATLEDHAHMRAIGLRLFQVADEPAAVRIVGQTRFMSTAGETLEDPRLKSLAQDKGADFVVAAYLYRESERYTSTNYVPLTTQSTGNASVYDNRGNWANASAAGSSTTYVPVVSHGTRYWSEYVAWFFRRVREGEADSFDGRFRK